MTWADLGWRWSAVISVLPVIGIAGAALNLLTWRPPITGVPAGFVFLLIMLSGVFLGTLPLPVFVFVAWRQQSFGLVHRLYFTAFSFAAITFAGWLSYWNLVGLRY